LNYGATNNRFWNLSPEDWKSMMEYVGFVDIETEAAGSCTIYRCGVPASPPARREDTQVRELLTARDAEIAQLKGLVAAYEQGRFIRAMSAVRNFWYEIKR
jgi:hypothetical protein